MMYAAVSSSLSPGLEEVLRLLRPPVGVERLMDAGYVDVLGEREAIGQTFAEQTMRSRKVVRIYEKLWRPAVSLAFLGLRGPRAEAERRILLGMLDLSPEDRVLDVGSGPGTYTRPLARAASAGTVFGLDASEPMLSAGVRRTSEGNVAYVLGDACALPFDDDVFDAVCSAGAFHVFGPDPMVALDEMIRVLAVGGRVALLTSCAPRKRHLRPPKGIHEFGRDELTGAMAERGLADIRQVVAKRGQFVSGRKERA